MTKRTKRVYVICDPTGQPSSMQMQVGGPLPIHPTKKRAIQYFPYGGKTNGWTIRTATLKVGKPVRIPRKELASRA